MVLFNIAALVAGFFCLLKGADYLVDGSSAIAKRRGISSLTIGLTIVAFGTSAPELVVTIFSSAAGSNGLIMGNIIGSNLTNILLILGLATYFFKLELTKPVKREAIFALAAIVVLALLANNKLGASPLTLTWLDGVILLIFFGAFILATFRKRMDGEHIPIQRLRPSVSAMFVVLGMAGLALGGFLIVDNSITIARALGWGEVFIGLTIIAIGTSLPELVTTIIAAAKKEAGISIGNIIGSNVFNTLFVTGIAATLSPLVMDLQQNFDLIFTIIVTTVLLIFIYSGGRTPLKKWHGAVFLALYFGIMAFFIFRGLFA